MQDLRESLAVAQNELTCLQSGPPSDGKSRGNSLFAEVEDKRQAMLKQTKLLSKKYTEMKKDYGAKCDEISRLRVCCSFFFLSLKEKTINPLFFLLMILLSSTDPRHVPFEMKHDSFV